MAAKRSRLVRSSSSGDISILSAPFFPKEVHYSVVSHALRPAPSPPPPPAIATSGIPVRKSTPEKNRPSIFTIGSPIQDPANANCDIGLQSGGFLEKCGYCRKKISQDDEVFMYSTLQAFCNAECRDKQIAKDMNLERMTAKPKLKANGKRAL